MTQANQGGARRAVTAALAVVALSASAGCHSDPPPTASAPPVASSAPERPAAPAVETKAAAGPASDANPLGLPPRTIELGKRRRLFTFSDRMLAGAKPGSTLVLYAATALGEGGGDELLIEGRAGGPSYKVHPGYVLPVPDDPHLRPGDPVVTEWNGTLKHGLVTRFVKDRVAVRYTDMDPATPEGLVKDARLLKQVDGLVAGNYAAAKVSDGYRHVLLVSPAEMGGTKRWLALGFGGAALLVDEADLRPIPVKWDPRPGSEVWAEWAGTMRKGTVQAAVEMGQFTVKFERAGKPVSVGWGLVMKPVVD